MTDTDLLREKIENLQEVIKGYESMVKKRDDTINKLKGIVYRAGLKLILAKEAFDEQSQEETKD